MFNKKGRREGAINTLVGGEARVQGDLEFKGGCLIDGYVLGNVRSPEDDNATLNVSERGCVEGTIEVPNVLLNGTVKGDVKASKRVELSAKARVFGNVEYALIEMAVGSEVNGKLVHANAAGSAGPVDTAGEQGPDSDVPPVASVKVVGESK